MAVCTVPLHTELVVNCCPCSCWPSWIAGSCWRIKGTATTTLHSAVLGAPWLVQLQVEIFPSGSDVLWGALLRNCVCYRQNFMHQKIQWLENATQGLFVVLLTQQVHSRRTYWASVISLQWSYSFQQSYRTCWICRGTTGWLKYLKSLWRRKVRILPLYLSYGSTVYQLGIIQAKTRRVDNHKCYMEGLTGSSIPEWAVRRIVSRQGCSNMNMEKAKLQKKLTLEHSKSLEFSTSSSLNKEVFFLIWAPIPNNISSLFQPFGFYFLLFDSNERLKYYLKQSSFFPHASKVSAVAVWHMNAGGRKTKC